MARKEMFAIWAGVGAALLLVATATGFALAADRAPTPTSGERAEGHGHWRGHPPGMMMPGPGSAMMIEHMADKLGLTTQQRESVHKALEEARPGFESLHEQARKDLEQLASTRPDDAGYQARVASASQSAGQTASQMVLQASQLRSRVFGVLTPAQRDQATALEAKHLARMREQGHGAGNERGHKDWQHAADGDDRGAGRGAPPTPPMPAAVH